MKDQKCGYIMGNEKGGTHRQDENSTLLTPSPSDSPKDNITILSSLDLSWSRP